MFRLLKLPPEVIACENSTSCGLLTGSDRLHSLLMPRLALRLGGVWTPKESDVEPEPLHTTVTNILDDSEQDTAVVTRLWERGDVLACRLCAKCTAVEAVSQADYECSIWTCTITVPFLVGEGQGAFLRLDGLATEDLVPLPGS